MNWIVDEAFKDGADRADTLFRDHLKPLFALQERLRDEAELRSRYPALKAAWDDYQLALRLVSGEHLEDEE